MIRLLLLAIALVQFRLVLCGRFNLTKPKEIQERFGFVDWHERRIEPRFNIAPSQEILTIVQPPGQPAVVQDAKWGLVPFWVPTDNRKPPPINARAETLRTSPMFRIPLVESRCLIPATGFYEWRATPGSKATTPMHIRLKDGAVFAFAGLWARGRRGSPPTAAIVTGRPNELVRAIHNRMPVILRPENEARWLDPTLTDPDQLLALLEPLPAELMEAYPVAPLVNSHKNDSAELIQPVVADPDSPSAATHTAVQIPFPHV